MTAQAQFILKSSNGYVGGKSRIIPCGMKPRCHWNMGVLKQRSRNDSGLIAAFFAFVLVASDLPHFIVLTLGTQITIFPAQMKQIIKTLGFSTKLMEKGCFIRSGVHLLLCADCTLPYPFWFVKWNKYKMAS